MFYKIFIISLISGSSNNIQRGVEYRNCCRTLDMYLLFAIWIKVVLEGWFITITAQPSRTTLIWMGQTQSKLIYIFVAYQMASL